MYCCGCIASLIGLCVIVLFWSVVWVLIKILLLPLAIVLLLLYGLIKLLKGFV